MEAQSHTDAQSHNTIHVHTCTHTQQQLYYYSYSHTQWHALRKNNNIYYSGSGNTVSIALRQ